ncbi:MAG: 66, gp66 [Microbacterium sp.]|jgi:site-specific DNA-methyltransferase (adenine-specific)|nr:66, gp66 [Microbacterium sp.]
MTAPYYTDEHVTLYHGDCREVLAGMADRSVAAVITDPPYSRTTHEMTRSNSTRAREHGNRVLSGNFGFDSISEADLRSVLTSAGRVTRGWVVATLDYRHAFAFDQAPPSGLRALRIGVWVKKNPNPQISGDRPAQGWEAIAYMHRDDKRPTWNGGGKAANYVLASAQRQDHPTAKPLPMVQDWVRLFTNPGDTVLDPFAGSGTTLRAALDEGRKAIGVELEERYCEVIAKRLAQGVLDLGVGA